MTLLKTLIINFIPGFEKHWDQDDIYREEDGSYTEHGIMSSFLEYYQHNYNTLNILELSTLCIEFEKIIAAHPNDDDPAANAICTMFLELLVDTEPGNKLELYLGKTSKEYWNQWKF